MDRVIPLGAEAWSCCNSSRLAGYVPGTRTMEKGVRSVQTFFVALTIMGMTCVDSIGPEVDGAAMQPAGAERVSKMGWLGKQFLAHRRSSYLRGGEENVDSFERNLDDQIGTGDTRRTARVQLMQASPNAEVGSPEY